jgi:hypothetical protein
MSFTLYLMPVQGDLFDFLRVREHHPELVEGLKVCQTPAALIADW